MGEAFGFSMKFLLCWWSSRSSFPHETTESRVNCPQKTTKFWAGPSVLHNKLYKPAPIQKKKNKKTKDKKSNLIKTRRKGVFSVELRLWLRNHRESIGATMRRLPMTTSFSFTLLLTTTFWTLSYCFVRPPTLLQLQSLSGSSNYLTKEELWFDQTLDHFSPYDHRRFPQRYYEFLDYFRPSDGPIFLKICGESACPGIANDYLSVSFDFWFLQKGYKLEKNRNFL